MVKVPAPDSFSVLPGVRSGRVDNPVSIDQATAPGRRLQKTGQEVMQGAKGIADIEVEEQRKANKVRLNDAFNKASTAANALRYDKERGYTRLKGVDAVKGIENKPLTDWYGAEL